MKPLLILCSVSLLVLAKAHAEPGSDYLEVRRQTADMLQKGDYQGLENLSSTIKKKGYDIRQDVTELGVYYAAIADPGKTDEASLEARLMQIHQWRAAFPDSLSAKIAEAKWYKNYAWNARGEGTADTITPQAESVIDGSMAKAMAVLKSVPENKVDDPEYYNILLEVAQLAGPPMADMQAYFQKAVNLAKDYSAPYYAMFYILMPQWYGQKGDEESFIKTSADSFPPEKGDVLYAFLTFNYACYHGGKFFSETGLDYNRAKHGYSLVLSVTDAANHNETALPDKWRHENGLAYLAAEKADKRTMKTMFLDLDDHANISLYTKKYYLRYLKLTGAQAAKDQAVALERAGNIAEAEKMLLSFTSDPSMYQPLVYFYERQGMKAKLDATRLQFAGKTFGEMSDLDVTTALPENLGEMAAYFPLMGEWDKAEAVARKFDQLRPQNLIGKNVLLLCAIQRGDSALTAAAIKQIAAFDTDRTSYLTAQSVLGGGKTFEDVSDWMKNNADAYLGQCATSIALYYMAQGKGDEARKVIETTLPYCAENSGKAILESLLYGSLARAVKPGTPVSAAETSGTNSVAPPAGTGTNMVTPPAITGTK